MKASIFYGSSPDSHYMYERQFTVVSEFIFIFRVYCEQKHATKKLSENMILICKSEGFCSIRENIRVSLVEPWFVHVYHPKNVLKTKIS